MAEVIDPALAEHDVVIQVLAQAFPQLHRFFVEMRGFIPQVIGTHDGRVAPGITAADPAFFEHRDIRHTMLFGQVIRGREAMTSATDD